VVEGAEAEGAETGPNMGALIDAELRCDNARAAVRLGERALIQMAGSRDEYSLMSIRANMVLALLALDDVNSARPLLNVAWSAAVQLNLHTLCSDSPALLAALEDRPRSAARLAGYADAAYEARGIIRHPSEVAARERSRALARAALGDATFDRLVAEGHALRDQQVAAVAFATEDSI